jgi:hypothetical protein
VLWKGEAEWEEIINGDRGDISKYNVSFIERIYRDHKGDLTPLDQLLLKMEFYPVKRRYELLREKDSILLSIQENEKRLKEIGKELKECKTKV